MEGDFNIDYDNINSSQIISNYANHINRIGCSQLVDKPSRISQISGVGTIIDHIFINSTLINYVLPKIIQDGISDHKTIYAGFKCKPTKKCTKRPLIRKLTGEGVDLFLAYLTYRLSSQELHDKLSLETLISLMSDLTNHYFPP